jgi:hypothetical protein
MADDIKAVFFYESINVGAYYTLMNQFCGYFGADPIVIDVVGHFPSEPFAYPSLQAVIDEFTGYNWVTLDPNGRILLDEFSHPSEPVIYLFGSDRTGFESHDGDLPGSIVKLRCAEVIYVHQCMPIVFYDREMSILKGR